MKRPSRPTPRLLDIPRGGRATSTQQWWTVAEVSRATQYSRHALYDRLACGELIGRKVPGHGPTRYEWLIDWHHAQKHLPPFRRSSAHRGQMEPISDKTWRKFLIVWGKFLRGECEPAPAGRSVRRR